MTLDDLRAFVAVCEAGSLSAVARDLGCTQSAVSQRVKRLEREAGIGLLERRPRGVAPTPAGRILHRAAADGLGGLDQALRRLADMREGDGGTVRVTTGATTVRHFMSDAVVAFRERHPGVNLEFHTESSSRRCFEAVAGGDSELAWITIGPPVRGIEQHPVIGLPWVLAVRAGDPLAARDRVEPDALAGLRLIRLPENSTSRMRLDGHLGHRDGGSVLQGDGGLGVPLPGEAAPVPGPVPEVSLPGPRPSGEPLPGPRPSGEPLPGPSATSVADWDTALLLAELGVGHAVVPRLPGHRATAAHPGLRLVPIPALPPLTTGWAVRQWAALSPAAVEFAETVNRCLVGGQPDEYGPGPAKARSATARSATARSAAARSVTSEPPAPGSR
ncbi:LysR family transcriptional regulator [Streptomyces sp. NRRL F-4489]|uniref:LysR family transcriptional regulator n=1 Tax=Streptomyces sp. NRRL F-4489 TaxID=1609095 RepID=UPI00074AA6B9|nr:LysR family transcriptional regulator [Streptomyces sp. NRRL F-4489]KUL40396.1 LysR family transcriptional regulator [Streptomyces sp. NRRL F-4489]